MLIALYPTPVWYNSVRKFTPVSTEAKRDLFSFYCSTASIFWDKDHIAFLYCFAISPWQGLQPAFIIPYFRVAPGYMTAAIQALGVADELSLVGLADISAPFSEAVSGDFESLFSLVSATMVELATWALKWVLWPPPPEFSEELKKTLRDWKEGKHKVYMIPTIMKMHLLQMLQGQVDMPQMVSLYSSALRKRGQCWD